MRERFSAQIDGGLLPPAPGQGWTAADRNSLFLFLFVAFIVPVSFLLVLHPRTPGGPVLWTLHSELLTKSISAFSVALATWLVSRRLHRPLDDFGVPLRLAFGWRFWEGALWGFAMLSGLLFMLSASGHFEIKSVALTGAAFFRYAFGWALAFLFVSISEELAFRGYTQFLLARRVRFWGAAAGMSVGFAVGHLGNPGESVIGILQVLGTGLLFCLFLRRTGNLWFALGYHAAWDWAETFFYGTADSGLLGEGHFLNTSAPGPSWISGGSVGPEGSVLALIILLLCALLIHVRFPKAVYPDRPS